MAKYKDIGDGLSLYDSKTFKEMNFSEMSDEYLRHRINKMLNGKMNEIKRFRLYAFNDILIKRRLLKQRSTDS